MAKELTPDERQRRGRELMLEAALDLTRLKKKMRRACRLVELQGKQSHEAAAIVGVPRQHVYRALLVLRPKLAVVEQHVYKVAAELANKPVK